MGPEEFRTNKKGRLRIGVVLGTKSDVGATVIERLWAGTTLGEDREEKEAFGAGSDG
jgi:hypothetical protein